MPNGWSALLALWLLAQTLGNEPVSTPMCAASFKVNGADETITLAAGATHDEAWRVSTAFVQKHSLTDGHGLQGDPDGVAARIARELRAWCGLNDACARAATELAIMWNSVVAIEDLILKGDPVPGCDRAPVDLKQLRYQC